MGIEIKRVKVLPLKIMGISWLLCSPVALPQASHDEMLTADSWGITSGSGYIEFNETSEAYQKMKRLLDLAGSGTYGEKERQVALKKQWESLQKLAPHIKPSDRGVYDQLLKQSQQSLQTTNSQNVVVAKQGEAIKAFNLVFPAKDSIFNQSLGNHTQDVPHQSNIDRIKLSLKRLQDWEERISKEKDPTKRAIQTYAWLGELTFLSEIRPGLNLEINLKGANRADVAQIKTVVDRYYQKFLNLSDSDMPLFHLEHEDDIQYILEMDKGLRGILADKNSEPNRKALALSYRRAILQSMGQFYKHLEQEGLLDKEPYLANKNKLWALAQENQEINQVIKRTNFLVDNANSKISQMRNDSQNLNPFFPQRQSILDTIADLNNARLNLLEKAQSDGNTGPNLAHSYLGSLQKLSDTENSLRALLNEGEKNKTEVAQNPTTQENTILAKDNNPKTVNSSDKKPSEVEERSFKPDFLDSGPHALGNHSSSGPIASEDLQKVDSKIVEESHDSEIEKINSKNMRVPTFGAGKNGQKEVTPRGISSINLLKGIESSSIAPTTSVAPPLVNGPNGSSSWPSFPPNGGMGSSPRNDLKVNPSNNLANKEASQQALGSDEEAANVEDGSGFSLRQKGKGKNLSVLEKNQEEARREPQSYGTFYSTYSTTNNFASSPSSVTTELDKNKSEGTAYALNSDLRTFSPVSTKGNAVPKKGSDGNGEGNEGAATQASFEKLKGVSGDLGSLDVSGGENPEFKTDSDSIWSQLGLQPTLDSLSQFLEELYPSEGAGKKSDITELMESPEGKLSKKNRETKDRQKMELSKNQKRTLLSEATVLSKTNPTLWEKFLAWLGI